MSQLRIANLAETKALDRSAMTSVRGGTRVYPVLSWGSMGNQFLAVTPTQVFSQSQNINNPVGNNVASFGFANIYSTNTQNQNGPNNVNVGGLP